MISSFVTHQVKGHGRGKLLGFPTINMEIPSELLLADGIYAAWIRIDAKRFMGALHYGPIPVFSENKKSLEVFLLDADESDIGDTALIEVSPVQYVREIQSFDSPAALATQIQHDVEVIRTILHPLLD
jgi:riboflavin kinase / FMN adenylyltransferase